MAEIHNLPVWKRGATAYERLSEIALFAKQYPDKFSKFALIHLEEMPTGNVKVLTITYQRGGEGLCFAEGMGLLSAGQITMFEKSAA